MTVPSIGTRPRLWMHFENCWGLDQIDNQLSSSCAAGQTVLAKNLINLQMFEPASLRLLPFGHDGQVLLSAEHRSAPGFGPLTLELVHAASGTTPETRVCHHLFPLPRPRPLLGVMALLRQSAQPRGRKTFGP